MSATDDRDNASVTLTFDADIDTDGMALERSSVSDGRYLNGIYIAYTTTGLDPNSVEMAKTGCTPGSAVMRGVRWLASTPGSHPAAPTGFRAGGDVPKRMAR